MSTQTFDQLPLGLTHGQVVMEIGLDSDCDDSIRDAFVAAIGQELLDEDSDEIVEAILLWWRDDDGDLVDGLMDALGPLADNGVIWLLTPKAGRDGHIEPSEISEAAPTAGLQPTRTISASRSWQGTRLVTPKSNRR
ncbi:MAG TPA: DUF3052 domain-containing protein [Actinomycetota bacterium]|jgi:hypothetical protein|nr:DUF3052 domain-containing protein [Candidatus Nanopelagicales bacterium]HPE13757.1 DUF3052 domain-containing protein [Actinomycetota bacterium]HPQ83602.1 DUF3052 domain-containing protein [Actinomycetota bacterium]HRV66668.1 DUF3052 domain-containing protein [Candidatus Nanopelagicales bacterium]